MKACEHFLPCGYCNKYDVPCKATADGIIDYNYLIGEIDLETAEEMKSANKCKHEWRYKGKNEVGHHYECIKCGTMKIAPLGSLYPDDLYFTDKECKHDWHINGQLHGREARYTMHTCSKCGKEETLKTYIDKDGRWITHSV